MEWGVQATEVFENYITNQHLNPRVNCNILGKNKIAS